MSDTIKKLFQICRAVLPNLSNHCAQAALPSRQALVEHRQSNSGFKSLKPPKISTSDVNSRLHIS